MNKLDYVSFIKQNNKPIEIIDDDFIGPFKWLSQDKHIEKINFKANSVQFIILKILNRNGQTIDIKKRDSFEVYVIGDFRKTFKPILRVAEAFADFYIEMGILPKIIPIPKTNLQKYKEILSKLKNGVLIYERR